MTALAPNMIVVCVKWRWPNGMDEIPASFAHGALTEQAFYFCERLEETQDIGFSQTCPWDGCGTVWLGLRDKLCGCCGTHIPYCPNLFRPLNDGDTSLVKNEKENDLLVSVGAQAVNNLAKKIKELIDE